MMEDLWALQNSESSISWRFILLIITVSSKQFHNIGKECRNSNKIVNVIHPHVSLLKNSHKTT